MGRAFMVTRGRRRFTVYTPEPSGDAPLYTHSEWENSSDADYEIVDGKVYFQGQAFNGRVKRCRIPRWARR